MAEAASEIKRWLETLSADATVAVDDGGLTLVEVGGEAYLEIGGVPEEEEDVPSEGRCNRCGCDLHDGNCPEGHEQQITAECHSDDRAVEVTFDTLLWFKGATPEQILALARCDWGGDYPADEVAQSMSAFNQRLRELFQYIGVRNKAGHDCGFECHVEGDEALAWLKRNRPDVAHAVEAAESQDHQ